MAVYARYLRTTGTYSCKLLSSRSYVLNGTIPRNELTSQKLATNFCVFFKSEVSLKKNYSFSWILFCDSQISLNWIKSYDKNLHLFAHYRSRDTRRNISSLMDFGTSDSDVVRNLKSFPLYFVQGTANPSDLLTKIYKYSVKLVNSVSLWQDG